MERCRRERVQLMGLRGLYAVEAWRHGEWAATDNLVPGRWTLTLLPLGLCLPPEWSCFVTAEAACAAMVDLQRLSNRWAGIAQADLTLALRDRIRAVCAAHGAVPGPVAIAHLADRSPFGRPITTRPNGYPAPDAA